MYSSEDLERFYFQYQTEALPHGESLQLFCVRNKVPCNIFYKWFKDTSKQVVEVQIDGIPVAGNEKNPMPVMHPQTVSKGSIDTPVRIWIGCSYKQRLAFIPKEFKLSGFSSDDRETGGLMLSRETCSRNPINYSEGMHVSCNNKFVKAANQGDGPTAGCFSNLLKSFFARTYL